MKKKDLLKRMEDAKIDGMGVMLIVSIDEYPEYEYIVVRNKNLKKKINYIDDTYDENLNHKNTDKVSIHSLINISDDRLNVRWR